MSSAEDQPQATSEPRTSALKSCPEINGYPFVGILPQLLRDPLRCLGRYAQEYPSAILRLRLGPLPVYLLTHPTHTQHVLRDNARNYVKGAMWKEAKRLGGNGVGTSEGAVWQRSRRMMQPLFAPRALSQLSEPMLQVIDEEVARLQPLAERGRQVDLGKEMAILSQRIFLKLMFGLSLDSAQAEQLGNAMDTAMRLIAYRVFFYSLPEWFPKPGERTLRRVLQTIDQGILQFVTERRRSGQRGNDLLSLLLDARDDETVEGIDDQQLRDELVTLYVAGSESMATALTWTWYMLDMHPHVQQTFRAEIDRVLGGRPPTKDDLVQLTYTQQVFQETLRLYPTTYLLPRAAQEEDVIDGYPIPAGSFLLVSPFLCQRHPLFWERPLDFEPERFSRESAAKAIRQAWIPFGAGPRSCMGTGFSIMEAQLVMARMAQHFRLRRISQEPIGLTAGITLKPDRRIHMVLQRA